MKSIEFKGFIISEQSLPGQLDSAARGVPPVDSRHDLLDGPGWVGELWPLLAGSELAAVVTRILGRFLLEGEEEQRNLAVDVAMAVDDAVDPADLAAALLSPERRQALGEKAWMAAFRLNARIVAGRFPYTEHLRDLFGVPEVRGELVGAYILFDHGYWKAELPRLLWGEPGDAATRILFGMIGLRRDEYAAVCRELEAWKGRAPEEALLATQTILEETLAGSEWPEPTGPVRW